MSFLPPSQPVSRHWLPVYACVTGPVSRGRSPVYVTWERLAGKKLWSPASICGQELTQDLVWAPETEISSLYKEELLLPYKLHLGLAVGSSLPYGDISKDNWIQPERERLPGCFMTKQFRADVVSGSEVCLASMLKEREKWRRNVILPVLALPVTCYMVDTKTYLSQCPAWEYIGLLYL